jgi:hypothetical protein
MQQGPANTATVVQVRILTFSGLIVEVWWWCLCSTYKVINKNVGVGKRVL